MQFLFSMSFASIFLFVLVLSLSLSWNPKLSPICIPVASRCTSCLQIHLSSIDIFCSKTSHTSPQSFYIPSNASRKAQSDDLLWIPFFASNMQNFISSILITFCCLKSFLICRLDKCPPFSSGHSPGRPNVLEENLGATTQSQTSPWQPPAPGVPGSGQPQSHNQLAQAW